MKISDLRSRYPDYSDLEIVQALQRVRYPDYSVEEVADAVGYKPPDRNIFAVANDTAIEFANAVAGGVGAAAEFVSPGNRFSAGVDEFVRMGQESQSDVAKESRARFEGELDEAQGVGDELAAVGKKVWRDPLLTAAQAAGSFVGPGAAVKGARALASAAGAGARGAGRAGLAGGAAAGGAMAGGDAAGTAYDLVQQTPEEVLMQHPEAARMAQDGMPIEQIRDELGRRAGRDASIIPALIGAAGGTLGAERLFAGVGRAGGGLAGAARGGISEAIQEGVEEGATQFEGQRAAAEFNPSIDPTKGVAAAAGMGAVLGGATGGALGALSQPAAAVPTAPTPEQTRQQLANEAIIRIGDAKTADEAIKAFQDSQIPITMPAGLDAEGALARLEAENQRTEQSLRDFSGRTPPVPVTRTEIPQGTAQEVQEAPFSDRVLTVREQLKSGRVRQQIRENLGPQALNDISYYASAADNTDLNIPAKTRDRMLSLAEALLSRAQAQPIQGAGEVRQIGTQPSAQPAQSAPISDTAAAMAGRVTPPTSVIEVSPEGAATPVVRAAGLVGEGRTVPPTPEPVEPLALPEPAPYRKPTTLAERAEAFTRAERDRENARRSQVEAIPVLAAEQEQAAAAVQRAATVEVPTAMQVAMQAAAQKAKTPQQIEAAANEAASSPQNDKPDPTPAQIEAGNYAKGHVRISGLDVSIENPKGSVRRSKPDAEEPWEVVMPASYGYIRGTRGSDGDHVDISIGPKGENGRFWVINQNHAGTRRHDEHKVITGVDSQAEAVALYKAGFADNFGDKVFGSVSGEFTPAALKARLPGMRRAKPVRGGGTMAQRADAMRARNAPVTDVPAPSAEPATAPDGGGDISGRSERTVGRMAADVGGRGQDVAAAPEPGVRAAEPVVSGGQRTEALSLRERAERKKKRAELQDQQATDKPSTKGQPNAPDQVQEQGRGGEERGGGDGGRKAAEAGGGDRPGRAAPSGRRETVRPAGEGKQAEGQEEGREGAAPTDAVERKPLEFDPDIPFLRKDATPGEHVDDVRGIVDAITDAWANAPEVVVLATFSDAPASVKAANQAQLQGQAEGVPAAFVSGGKVYIVADQMESDGRVVQALFHEALGHLGLRGTFGPKLGAILDDLATANEAQVREKAEQYGLSMDKPGDRLQAAEEVLAEMAEKTPDATLVQRAIAAIKDFLRKIGIKLKYSDSDIVAQFIVPARRFVTEGVAKVDTRGDAPFMRKEGASQAFMRVSDIRTINQEQIRNAFLDAVTSHGNVSAWGKTIGTQYHKAKKNPTTFGRVFNALQDYVKDINVFGNAAADQAPTILPKLENWTDLKKGGFLRHGEAKPADLKASGAAVFQGTLNYLRGPDGKLMLVDTARNLANRMNAQQKGQELLKAGKVTAPVLRMWQGLQQEQFDAIVESKYEREMLRAGVVFTDAELKSVFNLTKEQIGLYREFRAAVDQSLTDLVKTEMVRLAGKDGEAVQGQVMAAPSIEAATNILLGRFTQLGYGDPTRKDELDKTYNLIADKGKQVERLKAEGYAPLMRFGRHTLHIQKDGETVFFGMYEKRADANAAAREMRKDTEFNGAEFRQGLMSQEAYKLYAGMSLEALELFADTTGNANNPVYQDYLKLAKANRSAMKRMIHRQGTAGFSEDVSRVLASFVTSNSRMASGNLHLSKAKQAADAIPKEMGDLKDDAVKLVGYVQDPQEEAAALRGWLFTSFIGGSVASAAVNLTQPLTMTLPYLSQFGGAMKAGQHILAAARMAASRTVEGEIGAALKRAEADGIVSPQEIHHLQAEAMGRLGNHPALKKAAFVWGGMFSLAEQFNRRVSFIAAYNVAKENHVADPFGFAETAVIETQGLYNKGNKPNWARGPIGSVAMTFKQFSIHYLEFLQRMATAGEPGARQRREGRKAVAMALAILLLTAGAGGLPFADDLDDLIDTLAQAMGYDFNSKAAKRKFIAETLGMGDVAAEALTRGITALPGMPIDLSLRMGLGNLLPGTGAFLRSNTDRSRDVLEFAGAAGSLAKSAMEAGGKVLSGELADAAIQMAPLALQNMAKAAQMWNTGEYRNQRGYKVTDVDQIDTAAKFIGFQPADVARESAAMGRILRSTQLAKNVEDQIASKWAQGANDLDAEKVAEARRELADWNAKNPETPIRITTRQIMARVRKMRQDRAERTIKATPPELRTRVREEFQ